MTPDELRAEELELTVDRLFHRDIILDQANCWLAPGKNQHGYVRISVRGKQRQAHRLMYAFFRGSIPDDLYIDHLCRNRGCLNPWHMEVVTNAENVLRGEGITALNKRKTHCANGHEFTPENTRYDLSRGRRQRRCKECQRLGWYRRPK